MGMSKSINVSYANTWQRSPTMEKELNNQADRMTAQVSLASLQHHLSQCWHNGLMTDSHGGRDGGSAQQHGLPFTKTDLATATAEGPTCQ